MTAVYNSMPFVLVKDVWDYNTNTSVDSEGNAEILIQCAHGPCQRYIPVDQKSKWCYACDGCEHDEQRQVPPVRVNA